MMTAMDPLRRAARLYGIWFDYLDVEHRRRHASRETLLRLLQVLGAPLASEDDLPEVIRYLDHYFAASTYSLRSLFRDDQRWILNKMLESTTEEIERVYREIHERNVPLIRFLTNLGVPTPRAFQAAAEFALGSMLRTELQREELDLEKIKDLLAEIREERVRLEPAGLEFPLRRHVEHLMRRLSYEPGNLLLLRHLEALVVLLRQFPF